MIDQKPRIFISYSVGDRVFAERLAASLRKLGATSSLSGHGEIAQVDWLGELKEKLANSDIAILVMPASRARSANATFFEVGAARALGKEVIVVVPDVDAIDQGNIPYDVASSVVLDALKKPIETVALKVMEAA